jgi:hypothetical protein
MTTSVSRSRRLSASAQLGVALAAAANALLSLEASARPWHIPQSRWNSAVQNAPAAPQPPQARWNPGWGYGSNPSTNSGYQAYATPPLTPEQQAQRCNTGRLIGGLGGGAVAYAMSRDDGRAWAIPLGALLGSQVGCNTAAGRGPLPW